MNILSHRRRTNAPQKAPHMKKKTVPNRSAFIRKHPGVPAATVVALGKKAGVPFNEGLVYAVRSTARQKLKKATKPLALPSGNAVTNTLPASEKTPDVAEALRGIRTAILVLGVAETHEAVDRLRDEILAAV